MDIRVEHITKHFHGHPALTDFSAEFKSGRISGLLGPNGAGKTTFIRILNQILYPDQGQITIGGEALKKDHIHTIGYLPEERGLYKKMKVLEHVVYLARLKGLDKHDARKKATAWLDKLGLASWSHKRIDQLSKGMAQKVQFIGTVIHEPEILILDEPFSGFDPVNTNLIRKEILELKSAGKTILLSTHNMGSVEEICDDVVLLDNGRKVLEGKFNKVQEENRPNIFRIRFKGNIIGFTNALWVGYELIERHQVEQDVFDVDIKLLNDNKVNDLLKTTIPEVQILGVRELLPSMEEIFINSVSKDEE